MKYFGLIFAVGNWNNFVNQFEGDRNTKQDTSSSGGGSCVHICYVICLVMGTSRMVDSQWDIPNGDKDSRFRLCCQHKHAFHLNHRSGILDNALQNAGIHFLLLLWLDRRYGTVRHLPIARDQGNPHWWNGWCLEVTSSMEEMLQEWMSQN